MILDSTFLVDFEREQARRTVGVATHFLQRNAMSELTVTFTIVGELAAGESLGSRQHAWRDYIGMFRLLDFTLDVAWQYGTIYRILRKQGTLIGSNDLWIAATALSYGQPIVTRNASDFARIPNIEVLAY